jgi:hypothetical protein
LHYVDLKIAFVQRPNAELSGAPRAEAYEGVRRTEPPLVTTAAGGASA